jgi:hypothetical protein
VRDTGSRTEADAAAFERHFFGEPYDARDAGYEPDPPDEPDPSLPLDGDEDVPAPDWVEGYDDNGASERGSHWEDD